MKKILALTGILLSICILLLSIYVFVNINFVFSSVNGQLYDGFGAPYSHGEPNSPYTIFSYGGFITSLSLIGYCYNILKGENK